MNESIVILGAGESGVGAALLATRQGCTVFMSDGGTISEKIKNEMASHQIRFEENGHSENEILKADLVIKSPGIADSAAIVQKVRKAGMEVISEIEFAYRFKGDSRIVAVTGSNGKTTTTSMVFQICKASGLDVAMVGNIGYSFARQVALDPKKVYVAEVSSFQLDDIKTFRPDVAVLTNITEDHLDRYDNQFENYIKSKFRIMRFQTEDDVFIYNADDEVTMKHLDKFLNKVKSLPFSMRKQFPEGAYISDHQLHVRFKDEKIETSIEDFTLKGKHNKYNTMAASLASVVVGVRKESVRNALTTMESLEHRMQPVATIGGVEFINDSKATNINSTWYALESMEKPVVLILGGVDKGNDYRILKDLVEEKVHTIVCLGVDNKKIHKAFQDVVKNIVDTTDTTSAVKAAFQAASKGDVVLLSPACASFDLFRNYEDRGNQFIAAVKDL